VKTNAATLAVPMDCPVSPLFHKHSNTTHPIHSNSTMRKFNTANTSPFHYPPNFKTRFIKTPSNIKPPPLVFRKPFSENSPPLKFCKMVHKFSVNLGAASKFYGYEATWIKLLNDGPQILTTQHRKQADAQNSCTLGLPYPSRYSPPQPPPHITDCSECN